MDKENDGYVNMAKDEALLLGYEQVLTPVLRLYFWSEPFISLGYNQKVEDIEKLSLPFPWVRRITGGFCLLHAQEITYSIVCSFSDLKIKPAVKKIYRYLLSFLINFYRQFNLNPYFSQTNSNSSFFCFDSFSPFDILIEGKKIGGCALRKLKKTFLLQGVIPLTPYGENINFLLSNQRKYIFLREFIPEDYDIERIILSLTETFSQTYKVNLRRCTLSSVEESIFSHLLYNKYLRKEWNWYRKSYA